MPWEASDGVEVLVCDVRGQLRMSASLLVVSFLALAPLGYLPL